MWCQFEEHHWSCRDVLGILDTSSTMHQHVPLSFFFSFYLVWYEDSLCFKICNSPPAVHLCYRSDTYVFYLPAQQIILNTKSMSKKIQKAIYGCWSWKFSAALTNTSYCSKDWKLCATLWLQHIFTFLKLSLLESPFFTWPRFDIWKCNHEVLNVFLNGFSIHERD